jgi:hypothetical protein
MVEAKFKFCGSVFSVLKLIARDYLCRSKGWPPKATQKRRKEVEG